MENVQLYEQWRNGKHMGSIACVVDDNYPCIVAFPANSDVREGDQLVSIPSVQWGQTSLN